MRIYSAIAYAVGSVPLLLTVLAGNGPVAVLAGFLVTVGLWLGNLATARHLPMIRFGRWLNDAVTLVPLLAVAASPLGGLLADWWLAVPWLSAYGGAALVALSLLAWYVGGRWPKSLGGRVLRAVELLLLRGGILAVLVACVFHSHPALVTAAAGLAAAEIAPIVYGRITGAYNRVWSVDVGVLLAQPPEVRWGLWKTWSRDALFNPRRPDDSLLRTMVSRALDGVSGGPDAAAPFPGGASAEPRQLLGIVDEALNFLEGWVLLQEMREGQWEKVDDRITSIKSFASTAKAQLALSMGSTEEAEAELARATVYMESLGLPNMTAFGRLVSVLDADGPESALRIARDESLCLLLRRTAMFKAAYDALETGDPDFAVELYHEAAAIEPGRRDRAILVAEARRDTGRRGPSWWFRGTVDQVDMVGLNFARLVAREVADEPARLDLGEVNRLHGDANAGRLAVEMGRYGEAVATLSVVAEEAERRGQPFALFNASYWLARAHDGDGDPVAAFRGLTAAMDAYDLHRASLLNPDAADDLGGLTLAHNYAITLLLKYPEIADRPAVAAFELAERARSRGMLQKLGAAAPRPEGPDPLLDRERLAEAAYEATQASLPGTAGEERVLTLRDIRSARAGLAACWDDMIAAGGAIAEYAQLRSARPATYDEVRQTLADMGGTNVTAFEFHMTDDADMIVFVVRADLPEPAVIHIPHEHAAIYKALQRVDWHGDLTHLDEVLRPFLAGIPEWCAPGDVVCIAGFSSMHALPLHAMTVDGEALMDRNPVCYIPSLTVLRHCGAKRTGRRDSALILADSRADLPHARIQAAEIGALFPDHRGVGLIGDDATVEAITDAAGTVDLLHLACHGEFTPDDPLRSGILLAPPARLAATDLMKMRLRADLIAFSACQSALSEQGLGEELSGLAQAAMYAGTPSVLATLWSVDEIASSVLATGFYRRLLDGLGKAEALREAQRETRAMTCAELISHCEQAVRHVPEDDRWMLRHDIADARFKARDFTAALAMYEELSAAPHSPDDSRRLRLAVIRCRRALNQPADVDYSLRPFAHPYYWAPFVLIGDWR